MKIVWIAACAATLLASPSLAQDRASRDAKIANQFASAARMSGDIIKDAMKSIDGICEKTGRTTENRYSDASAGGSASYQQEHPTQVDRNDYGGDYNYRRSYNGYGGGWGRPSYRSRTYSQFGPPERFVADINASGRVTVTCSEKTK